VVVSSKLRNPKKFYGNFFIIFLNKNKYLKMKTNDTVIFKNNSYFLEYGCIFIFAHSLKFFVAETHVSVGKNKNKNHFGDIENLLKMRNFISALL